MECGIRDAAAGKDSPPKRGGREFRLRRDPPDGRTFIEGSAAEREDDGREDVGREDVGREPGRERMSYPSSSSSSKRPSSRRSSGSGRDDMVRRRSGGAIKRDNRTRVSTEEKIDISRVIVVPRMRFYKAPSIQSRYRPIEKARTSKVVRAFRCSLPSRCEGRTRRPILLR